jgi:hypothetical protein
MGFEQQKLAAGQRQADPRLLTCSDRHVHPNLALCVPGRAVGVRRPSRERGTTHTRQLGFPIGDIGRRSDNDRSAYQSVPVGQFGNCKAAQRERVQPTIGGSIYMKPQEIAWEPTQFVGISIKVFYEDKEKRAAEVRASRSSAGFLRE